MTAVFHLAKNSETSSVHLSGLGVIFRLRNRETGCPPDEKQVGSIAEKYDLTYQMEQIPALMAKYHLHDPRG